MIRIRATNAISPPTQYLVYVPAPRVPRPLRDHPMGIRGALSAIPHDCAPEPEPPAVGILVGSAEFDAEGIAEVTDEVGRILIERGLATAEPPVLAE